MAKPNLSSYPPATVSKILQRAAASCCESCRVLTADYRRCPLHRWLVREWADGRGRLCARCGAIRTGERIVQAEEAKEVAGGGIRMVPVDTKSTVYHSLTSWPAGSLQVEWAKLNRRDRPPFEGVVSILCSCEAAANKARLALLEGNRPYRYGPGGNVGHLDRRCYIKREADCVEARLKAYRRRNTGKPGPLAGVLKRVRRRLEDSGAQG